MVEIDIVFPPEAPLRDCHDLGEALQVRNFFFKKKIQIDTV